MSHCKELVWSCENLCPAQNCLQPCKSHPFTVPWSHIAIDFITESNGYTTILVIVNRFSKDCCLIPTPNLLTAVETVEIIFNKVFRIYGLPEHIESDREVQSSKYDWEAFFKHLHISQWAFFSGYNLQSNSQIKICWPGDWKILKMLLYKQSVLKTLRTH